MVATLLYMCMHVHIFIIYIMYSSFSLFLVLFIFYDFLYSYPFLHYFPLSLFFSYENYFVSFSFTFYILSYTYNRVYVCLFRPALWSITTGWLGTVFCVANYNSRNIMCMYTVCLLIHTNSMYLYTMYIF